MTQGALALAFALAPAAVAAQDAVEAPGRLADEDFYRLVACAAPPGGDCAKPFLHWQADKPIRVALTRIDTAYLGRRKQRAEAALTRALQALNRAEAGFRLARVAAGQPAEIEIHFVDIVPGSGPAGLAERDGSPTTTRLSVEPDTGVIRHAEVIVNSSLETPAFEATLLRDLTRAMGLATAVAGPAYAGRSVLAQTGPGPKTLAPQDITALRRHYASPAR